MHVSTERQWFKLWCLLIIKVWDIIIGVAWVALWSIVSYPQVVDSWQEDKDPNDKDRHGTIRVLKETKTFQWDINAIEVNIVLLLWKLSSFFSQWLRSIQPGEGRRWWLTESRLRRGLWLVRWLCMGLWVGSFWTVEEEKYFIKTPFSDTAGLQWHCLLSYSYTGQAKLVRLIGYGRFLEMWKSVTASQTLSVQESWFNEPWNCHVTSCIWRYQCVWSRIAFLVSKYTIEHSQSYFCWFKGELHAFYTHEVQFTSHEKYSGNTALGSLEELCQVWRL